MYSRIRIFFIVWLFAITSVSFAVETYYVFPDKFEIAQINSIPSIKIQNLESGQYKVILTFKASYQDTIDLISSSYVEPNIFDLDIIELPIEPTNFNFLTDFLEESNVVEKISKRYFGNRIRVELILKTNQSQQEIKDIFSFNVVYGNAKAKISCTNNTCHKYCGKSLSIPVFNQYKLVQEPSIKHAFQQFFVLNDYRNHILLGHTRNIYSNKDIDEYAHSALFLSGDCLTQLTPYHKNVCEIIKKYSHSGSLVDAIKKLAVHSFPDRFLIEGTFKAYILGQNDIVTNNQKKFTIDSYVPLAGDDPLYFLNEDKSSKHKHLQMPTRKSVPLADDDPLYFLNQDK